MSAVENMSIVFLASSHRLVTGVPRAMLELFRKTVGTQLDAALMALGSVGFVDNVRVEKGDEVLLCMQRDDGGWVFPAHYEQMGWTRSCPYSSYQGTMALYCSRNPAYKESLIRGADSRPFLATSCSARSWLQAGATNRFPWRHRTRSIVAPFENPLEVSDHLGIEELSRQLFVAYRLGQGLDYGAGPAEILIG